MGIALNKTGDRDTAKELVQETFINLYQHKSAIATNTSIRAYLYVILKNKIIGYYRHEIIRQKYFDFVTYLPVSEAVSPLVYVETRELEKHLANEVEKLPTQCRLVFKLSRHDHLTDKEIAAEMNISVNTVEQHKRKALRLLRTSMGDFLEIAAVIYLLNK